MVKPIVPHATDNIFGAARAIARAIRLLHRRSQREERLRSLLLSTAARDFPTLAAVYFRSCSRNRACNPPTSTSLAEGRTPPLTPPQHGGARFPDARSCIFSELLAQSRV